MTSAAVYVIVNETNGHFYCGSSISPRRRHRAHWNALRRGQHYNLKLQRAWTRDGESAFRWEVICVAGRDEVLAIEDRLLLRLVGLPECYNLRIGATRCIHSPETRAKISAANKARGRSPALIAASIRASTGRPATDAVRAGVAAANRRRVWTDEQRQRHSARSKRMMRDPERRERLGNLIRGKPRSEETRARMAEAARRFRGTPEGREATRRAVAAAAAKRKATGLDT